MPGQKYMFLHRSPTDGHPPSPARMQEIFAVWNAWKAKFNDNVVAMGGKLKPSDKVLTASGAIDGPLVEAKEIVVGYMVVTADSYDHAGDVRDDVAGDAHRNPGDGMVGSRLLASSLR